MSTPKRILIVDDDPDICTFMSEVLQDNAFETLTAGDGAEGLAKAREFRPALIVLDLMMPKKSGVRFLNEIKQDALLMKIPIIVLSGASKITGVDMRHYLQEQPFKERKEKVQQTVSDITPDAYLDKPLEPEILVRKVKELIGR